ncbi:potassium-transporting ATPase subunit C [Pseudonocardia sp. N23]|uniref:potassium-transporting ATPase subunit C n=1 Tax=Pseudonocardia sp. N23 TaxID=1987376 RepID=UPI000BFC34D7|nr:potassium-transporting ATPase subunit C [Pseudonocardia sp. N23]GAY07521.1 potassium-transporting ATPase C chain [Pseudonocardia sp. N23]
MLSTLRRQTATGLRLLIVLTVVCGIVYPLAVWGVSRLPGLSLSAEGSAEGSSVIGVDPVAADPAADPFFHTRPAASAAGVLGPADTTTSGGSNEAGDSTDLLDAVAQRRAAVAAREGVAPAAVPTDAVTASASGLDPDISPAYAALQAARVARVTGLPDAQVRALVDRATDGRTIGFLGEPTVDVTELNLAVQQAAGR